jgi:hypothetical protein
MTSVQIVPVSGRRRQQQFIELPWKLYRDDPHWIPPLVASQRELLHFKPHPFYDEAEIRTLLALRNNEVVGRIAAIVNHAHNKRHHERRGFFGFFESIDDEAVARALFDAACDWLREQGMTDVRGPMNPSMNYECGLLIEGFETPPFFMMAHSRPYYARLLEANGFAKAQDMYAFWGHISMLAKLDEKLHFIAREAKERFGIRIRPMNKARFREELEMFLDLYNQSMSAGWSFVPLSDAELRHMGGSLRHLIVPELAVVAEVEGKPVGAVFGLLDYNSRIKQIDGRLLPFGFLRLLTGKRRLKRMRVLSANVIPEWQRWGLGLILLGGLIQPILDWGIQEVEFSWVLESNSLSRGSLQKGGAKLTKTYRIYDRSL